MIYQWYPRERWRGKTLCIFLCSHTRCWWTSFGIDMRHFRFGFDI